MPDRAVLLIVRDDRLLLVHRVKAGQEYHVLPGGTVEEGETPEQAAVREAMEETGLAVTLQAKVAAVSNQDRTEHYFAVLASPGEPRIGGPEAERQSPENQYRLVWVTANELAAVDLKPAAARSLCEAALKRT